MKRKKEYELEIVLRVFGREKKNLSHRRIKDEP